MSGIGLAAIVLVGAWLGILTLVVVLLVRQVGLLGVRLDLSGPPYEPENDGPEIGSQLPEDVISTLPQLRTGRAYLVLLSATCTPCRELAAELRDQQLPRGQDLIALVPGRAELAESLVATLPPGMTVVRDPHATALAKNLQIESVPFALGVENGVIVGRARIPYLRRGVDLARFMEGGAAPPVDKWSDDSQEVIGRVRHAS